MRYRVTSLTPTLVGDGQRLAPIDYMVWKDHVNVLDQSRIFRLLAKGPRLEGYLSQLKRAEKLDFASWGGFAQNYAGRRIPFEHPSSCQYWDRTRAEELFIPTFATGPNGPYLPGSALKGALRTGYMHSQATEQVIKDVAARAASEPKVSRHPGDALEQETLGGGGTDALKIFGTGDSAPVSPSIFKIYLLRVSTLESRGGKYELAWKQSPRGIVRRAEDSTPIFAEMTTPGATFEGEWEEKEFYGRSEISKSFRKQVPQDSTALFNAVNGYIEQVLRLHAQYADWTGLADLKATVDALLARLNEVRQAQRGCLLALGWGAGFFSKTPFLDTRDAAYVRILKQTPFYARPLQSGLPFPKTRKILFLGNQPSSLPGFVHLEIV